MKIVCGCTCPSNDGVGFDPSPYISYISVGLLLNHCGCLKDPAVPI
jgi:hypothetical protein